jgi:hypothetical protein
MVFGGAESYPHFVSICNFRIFEGFEEYLGERYQDMFKGRGIGVMVKTFTLDIKRPVTYPDSVCETLLQHAFMVHTLIALLMHTIFGLQLIIANRILEVLPDRYYGITSIWSLRQQTIVADLKGYVVFFDYTKGKPANLLEVKGVYAKLHAGLTSKMLKGNELAAKWDLKHSKKFRAKI